MPAEAQVREFRLLGIAVAVFATRFMSSWVLCFGEPDAASDLERD